MAEQSGCPSNGIYHETHRYCPDCDWTEQDWSPLAWQIAKGAMLEPSPEGGVRARVQLYDSRIVGGSGRTSTDAMQDLARNLDRWNGAK